MGVSYYPPSGSFMIHDSMFSIWNGLMCSWCNFLLLLLLAILLGTVKSTVEEFSRVRFPFSFIATLFSNCWMCKHCAPLLLYFFLLGWKVGRGAGWNTYVASIERWEGQRTVQCLCSKQKQSSVQNNRVLQSGFKVRTLGGVKYVTMVNKCIV